MILECMVAGPLEVGCFIVGCEKSKEVVIIDPGGNSDNIMQKLKSNGFKPVYILATHGHFDHIGGVAELQKIIDCKFLLNKNDLDLVEHIPEQALFFGFNVSDIPKVDGGLDQDDIIKVGDVEIKVIETPGHTPGSVSLLTNNSIFVGDTVFQGSIGRTDLPGGSYETLINSVKEKLFVLDDSTVLYPGHGPSTTLLHEKKYNPFLNTIVL